MPDFPTSTVLHWAIGSPLPPSERADDERHVSPVCAVLGEEVLAAAWANGRALTLE